MLSNIFKALPVNCRPLRVWFEKIVPHVGTRNVNVRPDLVQDVILREVTASNLFVTAPKLLEDP